MKAYSRSRRNKQEKKRNRNAEDFSSLLHKYAIFFSNVMKNKHPTIAWLWMLQSDGIVKKIHFHYGGIFFH